MGLRPTTQRVALHWLLFGRGDRHLTAEMLHQEATQAKVPTSLATVYNTLHQFAAAGLLRQVSVAGTKSYFDTDVSDHHHFYLTEEQKLIDIPAGELGVNRLPAAPKGFEIVRVEVTVSFGPCKTVPRKNLIKNPS